MGDLCDARAHFVDAFGGRAFDEVWIAELRFEFRRFSLQFLLFAIEALPFLFEVDQAFERNCQLRAAAQYGPRRGFRGVAESQVRSPGQTQDLLFRGPDELLRVRGSTLNH